MECTFDHSSQSRLTDELWCYSDASLAPGGSRRSGVVVKWGDHLIACMEVDA